MEKTLQAAITEARISHLESDKGYFVVAEIDAEGLVVEHYVLPEEYLELAPHPEETDDLMVYSVDEDGEEWFSAKADREFAEPELNMAAIWDSIPDEVKPYVL